MFEEYYLNVVEKKLGIVQINKFLRWDINSMVYSRGNFLFPSPILNYTILILSYSLCFYTKIIGIMFYVVRLCYVILGRIACHNMPRGSIFSAYCMMWDVLHFYNVITFLCHTTCHWQTIRTYIYIYVYIWYTILHDVLYDMKLYNTIYPMGKIA